MEDEFIFSKDWESGTQFFATLLTLVMACCEWWFRVKVMLLQLQLVTITSCEKKVVLALLFHFLMMMIMLDCRSLRCLQQIKQEYYHVKNKLEALFRVSRIDFCSKIADYCKTNNCYICYCYYFFKKKNIDGCSWSNKL